ncbi:MAG: CapA family protein, partial [Actinomycetota bacterium]
MRGQPASSRSGLAATAVYVAAGLALLTVAWLGAEPTTSTTTATAPVVATSVPPAPAATTTTEPPPGPVTIAFGGDVHFEGLLAEALANEPLTMLEPVADMMADADLAIVNLETAVTDRGQPSDKQFNFRTSPAAFDALRAAGIDVVSMANNHGLDFGLEGLEDSLDHALAADFPVVGIGRDADEAYAPWSTTVNGRRIAVIGATQVLDSSLISSWTATADQPGLASAKEVDVLTATVAAARDDHDTVVVFLHWGIEGETCPAPRQLELSDALVAAGADLVVGGHAHRVQGGGRKDGAFVHYGLGNFVFYTQGGPGTVSGVLRVTVSGRTIDNYEWVPARLRNGVATRLGPEE